MRMLPTPALLAPVGISAVWLAATIDPAMLLG